MTTYTTITNALVAVGAKPFATTIQALRDNPIAIAENDASVPAALRSYILLATIPTTSGTAWTASSLVLTPFSFLVVYVDGLSVNIGGGQTVRLNAGSGAFGFTQTANLTTNATWAIDMIHLDSGMFVAGTDSTTSTTNLANTGVSRATTSITFDVSGAPSGDAGSIKLYGVK